MYPKPPQYGSEHSRNTVYLLMVYVYVWRRCLELWLLNLNEKKDTLLGVIKIPITFKQEVESEGNGNVPALEG